MYRATFADGSHLHVRRGTDAMADEVRSVCGRAEAAAFRRFVTWLTELFQAEMAAFIDRNYRSAVDICRPPQAALRLFALGGLRRLDPKVRSFFRDERLVRLFSFQSLYAGVAPSEALALFSVITYMDTVAGVFYPDGGMAAMARALADAATKAGASFSYRCPVARIELSVGTSGPVRGVVLASGERVPRTPSSATSAQSPPTGICCRACPRPGGSAGKLFAFGCRLACWRQGAAAGRDGSSQPFLRAGLA